MWKQQSRNNCGINADTPFGSMASRPSWKTTNETWEWEVSIWERMARGDNDTQVVVWLQLQEHPLDRDTVAKVRRELESLPAALAETLTATVQVYWRQLKRQYEDRAFSEKVVLAATDEERLDRGDRNRPCVQHIFTRETVREDFPAKTVGAGRIVKTIQIDRCRFCGFEKRRQRFVSIT